MSLETKRSKIPFFIGLLALTQLFAGILSTVFLARTDTLYSEIIAVKVQTLKHLQVLTVESANIQRYCLSLLLAESPAEIQSLKEKIASAWEKKHEHLERIESLASDSESERLLAQLKNSREVSFQACQSFIDLVAASTKGEALTPKAPVLHHAFEAYQATQVALGDYVHNLAAQASDATSAQTNLMKKVLLGFTTWPFILGLGLVLVFLGDILWRVWQIRQNLIT